MFYEKLSAYLHARIAEFDTIPASRIALLSKLTEFIRESSEDGSATRLTFICTHNSRRSHMAQLWAAVAAMHCSVETVEVYSGGTETTAFNPRAVAALSRAGFELAQQDESDNPRYSVRYSLARPPIECFSKLFDDKFNPPADYAAVMTCDSADRNCPVVTGATVRIAIPFIDPKAGDGTDKEAEIYDERCAQIAREILFAFGAVGRD